MLSVPAIYEDGKLTLLEKIPHVQRARAIVTILEEWPPEEQTHDDAPLEVNWLGSLHHTLTGEIGDIISPPHETWNDWEILRA